MITASLHLKPDQTTKLSFCANPRVYRPLISLAKPNPCSPGPFEADHVVSLSSGDQSSVEMGGGFLVGVFGVFILAHAAYLTVQHRNLLKIREEEFSGPPIKVVVELLLGLVLCMWAALTVPGKFLSIHPDSDENRIVSLPVNPDFIIFNHRGKACPMHTDLKLK